jgi:hypothetical protein
MIVRIPPKVTADSGDRDRLGNRGGAGGVDFARSVTISQMGDAHWAARGRWRMGVFFVLNSQQQSRRRRSRLAAGVVRRSVGNG